MDVTAMLNTASTAAAVERKLQMIHERKDSSDEELGDAMQTPSATTGGSTAPSSMAATPLEKTPSRRSSDSRTPNRNRTPWDAGGYSLSLALDNTKKLVQTSPGTRTAFIVGGTSPIPRDVLPTSAATPTLSSASATQGTVIPESGSMDLAGGSTSPRHKFSDSRSSFSSAYTNASSTNNSVAHSRISSLSTVSENQPLAALITDFSLLETRISEPCVGLGHAHHASSHQLKLQQYSFNSQTSPSREGKPDVVFQPESPTPVRSRHNMSTGASPEPSPRSPGRVQSPSDAMLIQRQAGEAKEARYFPNPSRLQIPSSHHRSQTRGELIQTHGSPTRRHKRAVSAPDFPSIGSSSFNPRFPTFGPIPEPTPSPSQHSDGNGMEHDSASSSPIGPEQTRSSHDARMFSSDSYQDSSPSSKMTSIMSSSPQNMSPPGLAPLGHHSHTSVSSVSDQSPSSQSTATPSADLPANLEFAPVCMYRGDCQTGSQLRKAISHIFGRNKLCTRMIPTGVWVHYCRKHYQRTRYRNGGEYPQRQIGLVQEQVRRVQAWSDSNVQQNRGPVLKDWSLSVRKREQLRLDSKVQASAGKKRPFHDDGMEDEDLDNFDDRAEMSGTAVPAWVVEQIGDGYSTPSILAIVERLKNDIDQGRLQQIPDIEILPNIVTDSSNDEPASNNTVKKTYTKRRTAVSSGLGVANAHRRSQSVNTSALRYDSAPMVRRSSQPNNYMDPSSRSFAADYLQLPMEKRQRVDGESIGMGHRHHQHHHSMSGILDRYEPLMAHRPGFNGRVQLAHRPAFAGIRESHAEGQAGYYPEEQRYGGGPSGAGDVYAHQNGYVADRRYSGVGGPDPQMPALGFDPLRDHERHHSTSGSGPSETGYGVLPAPNPQRFGGPSVAQQLESSSYVLNSAANRRAGVHQRSQSEAGFFHHMSSSQYGRPTSSGSHTQPQLSNLPRLSTNFTEEEPRTGYPPYQHHRAQNSQSSHLTAHRAPGHGHSQSMGHAHHYSHSGNLQDHNGSYYNQYNAPGRYTEDERRNSLNNEQPQPPAFGPSAAGSSNGNFDKFENVQLPPLQNVVQPAPPLLQSTVPHASALDSSAAAQPTTAEGADRLMPPSASHYPGHSRHQSSSSVAHVLSPSTETNNMSSYTAVPAHATAPQPLDAC